MHVLACDIVREINLNLTTILAPHSARLHKDTYSHLLKAIISMRLSLASSLAILATLLLPLTATSCSVRNSLDVTCPIENYEDLYMFANYLRQTTKSLRPPSTLRSLSSTSSSPSAPSMASSTTTNPSTEPQEQNNESNESKSPPLALPPTSDSTDQKLDVNGQGTTVSLDHLGPIVVNQDGTMSRISNWDKMTEIEQKNTIRIIGKRNKQRLEALKAAGVEAGES